MAQDPNIKIIANKQFWLNSRDFLRGAAVAAFASPAGALIDALLAPTFEFSWKGFLKGAIAGLLGYLLKNLTTPSNTTIQIATDSPKDVALAMKAADSISIDKTPGNADPNAVTANVALGDKKPVVTTSTG